MTQCLRLVVACAVLVHALSSDTSFAGNAKPLPDIVAELHDQLLSAAKSGVLDDFKAGIEASHPQSDFGDDGNLDAGELVTTESADPQGHEALAALAEILELPFVALPLGRDLENNLVYVWPYLAEHPLDSLDPPQEIELYRLVPQAKIAEMRKEKRWLWWRIEIGADGRLLSLKKHK